MKLFPKAVAALMELLQCPEAGELLARRDLSAYLRRAIQFMQNNGQNEIEIKGHNLVYLHVNYNTFRLAFWALSNLLETPEALEALKSEVEDLLESRYDPETGAALLDAKDLENLKILGMLHLTDKGVYIPVRPDLGHGALGNSVGLIIEVNQRRARFVLGWVTVVGWVNHLL